LSAADRLRRSLGRISTRIYRPKRARRGFSWIGDERIAIGALPLDDDVEAWPAAGITHVVNCRAPLQNLISQDLWLERRTFGAGHVASASMWDNGGDHSPERWADAVRFAVAALESDPQARVLVHCQQGQRRSAMITYAVLRLRGHDEDEAARLVLTYRPVARLVPAYRLAVERWLAAENAPEPARR
jgi:protein-tyrosine phosphatase